MKHIKYIDLFGGIGGFRLGIEKAAKEWRCVWYCDNDKYAVRIYNKNFREAWSPADIRTVKTADIPDFDLLCAGFPCQAFSLAGKRGGFKDTRGTLFFEIARILEAKRPSYFLLENVKGLVNHNKGETFKIIIQTLSELGYGVQWMVLNSKFFGVPQNRERVFIIGSLGGTSRPEILPFGESSETPSKLQRYKEVANIVHARITADSNGTYIEGRGEAQKMMQLKETKENSHGTGIYSKEGKYIMDKEIEIIIQGSQAQRVYTTDLAPTLKALGGGQGAKTGLYAIPVLTPDGLNKRQNGRRFKEDGDPSFTLTGQDRHGVMIQSHSPRSGNPDKGGTGPLRSSEHSFAIDSTPHYVNKIIATYRHSMKGFKGYEQMSPSIKSSEGSGNQILINGIRRLTPVECERLQGFSDGWTEGLSDTQRYKCLGNAVTVNVIEAIISSFIESQKAVRS